MASDDEHVFENSEENKPEINGKKERNTFLDKFAKITHNQPKLRLKSSAQILRHLWKNNENTEEELKYTIGRLIRGLGSAKLTSRIGFFTTLTVLLQETKSEKYDINGILEIIEKELHTSGQNSKSENADILGGHILVAGAVMKAGKLGELTTENRKKLLQNLVDSSAKKSYLGLLAISLVIDSLSKMDEKMFSEDILPILRPQLKVALVEYTLDQLYLLLKLQEGFPGVINAKFFKNLHESNEKSAEIVTSNNLRSLVHILMNVLHIKNIPKHPVYSAIAVHLGQSDNLPQFLQILDDNFDKPTDIKHEVYANLLTCIIKHLKDPQHLPLLYGKLFLLETIKHFRHAPPRTKDEGPDEIKESVRRLLEATSKYCKENEVLSSIKLELMKKLLFFPGTFIFEKVTGSKLLQQITATLDLQGVKDLALVFAQVMLAEIDKQRGEDQTETWLNLDRVYASQLIVKLMNLPIMRTEDDWKHEQLELFIEVSLLRHSKVGVDLVKSLKDTFFTALDIKFGKLTELVACLTRLVRYVNEKLHGLRVPLDENAALLWNKVIDLLVKVENKKKSHLTLVFHALFLHMALQLLNDGKLATESLEELFACYERRKSKDLDVQWVEVVVDLFLNLLSYNSHLLRSLISKVFPHLCKHLTASSIHQILHVLDPKSDDNPLSNVSDSDSDSNSEKDSDDDEVKSENESNNSENDDDSDEDGADFDDIDDEDDVNETDKLRLAIQGVLSTKRRQLNELSDAESVDMDDMSETECDQLNEALGEAFKRFKPHLGRRKSKKQTRDEETLTHFRVRSLDLLDIYLDSSEVSMIIALEIMLPLLQSLEFSIRDHHQKPLNDRIKSTLKKLASLKQFASVDDVSEDILATLLQSILEKGNKSSLMVQEMGDKIADCCIFIVNCSQHIHTKQISKILLETLETFFMKRDCLTPYVLFKNVLNSPTWVQTVSLLPSLVGYVFDESIRPFRRRQALELLRIFYLNNRLIALHKEKFAKKLVKVEIKLNEKTVEFFSAKEYKSKEIFINSLFMLLSAVKNCCVQSDAFNWSEIGELIREYRSGISLSNDTKSAFNKLCGALKIPNIVKMKEKLVKLSLANDEAEKNDENIEKEEKKKGNKEAKKLKKQTRDLRMKSLSEGMSKSTFANANVDELNHMEIEQETTQENGKHEEQEEDVKEEEVQVSERKKSKKSKKRTKKSSESEQKSSPKPKKKKK